MTKYGIDYVDGFCLMIFLIDHVGFISTTVKKYNSCDSRRYGINYIKSEYS